MKGVLLLAGSLLISAAAFAWFTWPLLEHPDCIPAGVDNPGPPGQPQHMAPGDHLQLLYHAWLFSDYVIGKTPFFHDLYELNAGDDQARVWYHTHQFPFPLLYRPLAALLGLAAGWNLTLFASLWLGYLFTWLLLRRYLDAEWQCALAALPALIFPYRYTQLCGGSPAGLAMMWTPAVWLGLEMALREKRVAGGLLAGAAILLGLCSDLHVFFFTVVFLPAMGLLALLNMQRPGDPDGWAPLRRLFALMPAGVGLGLAGLFALYKRRTYGAQAESFERSLTEVEQYSHDYRAFLTGGPEVYLGLALGAFIALGLLVWLFGRGEASARDPGLRWRRWAIALLLGACVGLSVVMAMGVRGPLGTNPAELLRAVFPPYAQIRQVSKVFIYMPLWLSVLGGLALSALAARTTRRGLALAGGLVVMGLAAFEYRGRLALRLCAIDEAQPAWAAVAADSAAAGHPAHVLALPLFGSARTGSSVYMHYASLYRVRMVNGYSPVVPRGYTEQVLRRFRGMNDGAVDDAQLDDLRARGIRHLVFHEDLYRDGAGLLPGSYALARLLRHPRLERLERAGSVWAFRILEAGGVPDDAPPGLGETLPNYLSEAEATNTAYVGQRLDGDFRAASGAFVILDRPGEHVKFPPARLQGRVPGLRGAFRARGLAECVVSLAGEEGEVFFESALSVTNRHFTWHAVDLSGVPFTGTWRPRVALARGEVELDLFKLAGPHGTAALEPGETAVLPALSLYHEGVSDLEDGVVLYRTGYEPWGGSFKSPELALPPGRYRAVLDYAAGPAFAGRPVFNFFGKERGNFFNRLHAEVTGGEPAAIEFSNPYGLPMSFHVHYPRVADLRFRELRIERLR